MRAGLPLRASLNRLREKIPSREVDVLIQKVEGGERLGESFAAARFSAFESHLVTAGEQSGKLDPIFEHLADFWSKELALRQALVRSLYYPAVVLHLAIVVGALMEVGIGQVCVTVALVHFVMALATLYVAAFVAYTLVKVTWANEEMRKLWFWVPLIGGALRAACAFRWITALRMEFIAGISFYRAVGDAWRASGYTDCEARAQEGEQAMLQGTSLSTLVQRWRQLPRDWVDFLETGEVSGQVEATLTSLQEEAERSWKLAQDRLTSWLPKILYFFLLLIGAGMVFVLMYQAVVAPMKTIEDSINGALNGR